MGNAAAAPADGARAGASAHAAPLATALATAGRAVPVALLAALPGLVFLGGFDHLTYGMSVLAGLVLAGLLIAPHLQAVGADGIVAAVRARFGPAAARVAAVVVAAVALPLLVAEIAVLVSLAESLLPLPGLWALAAAGVLIATATLVLRGRPLAACAALAYGLIAAAILVPLALIGAKHGAAIPHLAFGHALDEIRALEESLIEAGAVDFETFAAHTAPFVRLLPRDAVALSITLALGMAVLPSLVCATGSTLPRAARRLAGAWTALLVMVPLISVPPLVAYAKLEIYGAMAKPTPLADLPAWLEAPLRSQHARLHGTSLHLQSAVTDAVRSGAGGVDTVAAHLAGPSAAQWSALGREVQDAVLAAARALAAAPLAATDWDVYRTTVAPVAGRFATGEMDGHDGAVLTQAGLVLEPLGVLLALPGLTGFPREVALLLAGAIFLAALLTAASLAQAAVAAAAGESTPTAPSPRGRAPWLGVAVVVIAAAVALGVRADSVTLVVAGLALGGAGLFPVLATGLVWRRATAAGAIAAMLVGGGVALYYMGATALAPRHFYATWAPLSDAGEEARETYAMLAAEVDEAETAEARAAAQAALDDLVRGTATRAGLASWAGIDGTSSAVFGVPAGFVALILVSLVTGGARRARAHP